MVAGGDRSGWPRPVARPAPASKNTGRGIYRSAAGQAAIADAYERWMERLPTDLKSLTVPTRYGQANVVTAAEPGVNPRRPAIVALPGTNFPALAWSCLFEPPLRDRRVFAVDLIGQPGRSEGARQRASGPQPVAWLDDLLTGLDLPEVTLIGHSLGGQLALRYAAARPGRVHALALVCPGGLMRLHVPPRIVLRTIAWLARPGAATSRGMLRELSEPGQELELLVDWMSEVGRHVRISLAPQPLSDRALRQVTCPILVVAGEQDPFLPGRLVARAANRRLSTATTVVISGRHLLPHDEPRQVLDQLSAFLQREDQV